MAGCPNPPVQYTLVYTLPNTNIVWMLDVRLVGKDYDKQDHAET